MGRWRPTFRPLTLRARDHTAKALQALVGTLHDPTATAAAKVSAAIAVLDRGWGKPTERHEHVSLNAVAELSDDELRNAGRLRQTHSRYLCSGEQASAADRLLPT